MLRHKAEGPRRRHVSNSASSICFAPEWNSAAHAEKVARLLLTPHAAGELLPPAGDPIRSARTTSRPGPFIAHNQRRAIQRVAAAANRVEYLVRPVQRRRRCNATSTTK